MAHGHGGSAPLPPTEQIKRRRQTKGQAIPQPRDRKHFLLMKVPCCENGVSREPHWQRKKPAMNMQCLSQPSSFSTLTGGQLSGARSPPRSIRANVFLCGSCKLYKRSLVSFKHTGVNVDPLLHIQTDGESLSFLCGVY